MSAIDLDSETIQFDGGWFTRDDLARRIRAMLDAGDYNVAKPSQALEQLTGMLQGLRTLAIRVTPDMADALNQAASRQGKTAAGIVREALANHLGMPEEAAPPPPVAVSPPAPAPTPAKGVTPASRRTTTDPDIPVVPVVHSHNPSNAVVAGPGAMRAASAPSVLVDKAAIVTEDATPEDAAGAVDLNKKKKEDEA